jgi:hypothetical protein
MGFRPEKLQQPEEEIKEEQQPDTVDISGAGELDKKGTAIGADTEIVKKQEEVMEAELPSGEYGKLALQLGEFKALWTGGKEKEAIKLAKKMSGRKIKSAEEAKEIYEKKLGLYKTAEKIISSKKIKQQLARIIKDVKEAGEYEKDGKKIKLRKGEKVNGRLILDKKGEYHFEIAGKYFDIKKGNKIQDKKGKKPLPADEMVIPPPLPQEPPELPRQEQQEPPALPEQLEQTEEEPAEPVITDQPTQEQELPDNTKERVWGETITPPVEVKAEEVVAGDSEAEIDPLRGARLLPETEQQPAQPETPAEPEFNNEYTLVVDDGKEKGNLEIPVPERSGEQNEIETRQAEESDLQKIAGFKIGETVNVLGPGGEHIDGEYKIIELGRSYSVQGDSVILAEVKKLSNTNEYSDKSDFFPIKSIVKVQPKSVKKQWWKFWKQ